MCFDVPRCSFMFFVYRNPCFLDCFLSESLGPQDKPMACQTSWQQFAPGDCKARFVWLLRIVEKLILVECSINVEKWEGSNMFCLSQKWLETRFLNKLSASVCYILDESCASIKAREITEVFSGENSQTIGRTCLTPLSLFYPFSWKRLPWIWWWAIHIYSVSGWNLDSLAPVRTMIHGLENVKNRIPSQQTLCTVK